jgi:hypothetical protein
MTGSLFHDVRVDEICGSPVGYGTKCLYVTTVRFERHVSVGDAFEPENDDSIRRTGF